MAVEHGTSDQDPQQQLAALSEDEIAANLANWNKDAIRFHQERARHFSAIDEATIKSGVLERYLAAAKAAGLTGHFEFGVSDAQETAYGMGYPVRTRTIFVFADELMEGLKDQAGAVVFQLDRGAGFEAPYVDFQLGERPTYNFASRAERLTREQQLATARPYWLSDTEIDAFDITQPEHLRPGQLWIDGRDTAYMFGGNSGLTVTLGELDGKQAAIDQYFQEIAAEFARVAQGGKHGS